MTGVSAHRDLKILFEDDRIIAIDKPAGLLVIETPKRETHTLTRVLNDYLDAKGVAANAYPCHRIDRDTSGLILYAKGKAAQKFMMDEFKARRVKKAYIAFVHGRLPRQHDTITAPLYNKNKRRKEPAITRYRVLESRGAFSVVEVEPVTGRTNQIRRHFSGVGHPLVGERVFAFARDYPLKFRRAALHARSLTFTHPVLHERMTLSADLPIDMKEFLRN